jgi:8-amino-7-oxononanoate synthase
MPELSNHFSQQLAERASSGRLRTLKTITPGPGCTVLVDRRPLINFGSNDYLALSSHELLKQRAIEYTMRYGAGSTASRLICGNIEPYEYVERKLAALKRTEAAIILSTGYQANLSVLSTVLQEQAFAALDRLSHNSLLQGAQLSKARWARYNHNDITDVAESIGEAANRYGNRWIVTESVFSMDGDRADIGSLAQLAEQTGSSLYVDEAHAMGVLGEAGMGLAPGISGVTIAMGTFGKACGSFGAYIACSNQMRDYLVNFCGGIVYSTALPPAVLGAIDAALDLIPTMEKQRQLLLSSADYLRTRLQQSGYDTCNSSTQIVPVIVGSDVQAMALSEHLEDGGIFAPAIRPPTVPEGAARIRFSLTLGHTREHLDRIINLMRNWHAR